MMQTNNPVYALTGEILVEDYIAPDMMYLECRQDARALALVSEAGILNDYLNERREAARARL